MKILLIGKGKMGRLICDIAAANGDEVVAAFEEGEMGALANLGKVADIVIDFSRPGALPYICDYVRRTGTALLSGTTGLNEEQLAQLQGLGEYAPVLWSANYSLGVAALAQALRTVTQVLGTGFEVEITEIHHNQKEDAPSGTAKLLAKALDPDQALTPVYGREGACGKRKPNEIGIHALRGGTVAGTHTVHFFGPDEELEFTHRAASRQIFVYGALHMARKLITLPSGAYDLQKILFGG